MENQDDMNKMDAYFDKMSVCGLLDAAKKNAILVLAARYRHFVVVKKLISMGANVNAVNSSGFGETALHWAAERGDIEMVEFLVTNGADIDARDTQGRSPIDWVLVETMMALHHMIALEHAPLNPGRAAVFGLLVRETERRKSEFIPSALTHS